MKYYIVSDIPGRMRIRYGRDVFSCELENSVQEYFAALPYVEKVKANYLTGSVLIFFSNDMRDKLLIAAKKICFASLVPIEAEDEPETRLIDTSFKNKLLSLVGWKLVRNLLLPSFIQKMITIFRSIRFLQKGWASLSRGKISVEVLDAAAVGVSMLQNNFGTAASIMFLLGLSELLEEYTLKKTKSMLSSSLLVNTETVWLEADETITAIPIGSLKIGDTVVVRTGSTIPIDGLVQKGEALVNQSAMTGEPLAVLKKAGDSVFAGTVVEEGSISIEVKALASDTRISQIVDLISESENLKASIQGKAERIADGIVPFSFLLAAGIFLFTRNATKALSVLLVDYSCAIKLATPIAVISAMKLAASRRILVKGGKFFEIIAEADTIVFDKTGTLTVAQPTVSRVIAIDGYERTEVLRLAACMEEHFPHSVARAVVRAAKEEDLHHEEEHADVEYIVAHGIATHIHGKRAILGSHHFIFEDERIPACAEIDSEIGGDSAIYLAVDGKLAGVICIQDSPRPEAASTIAKLRELGIQNVIMLTGDSESAAKLVCEQLNIDKYYAQILPEDKAAIIEEIKAKGCTVIMVGDGINDSPALAAANVSVSMKDSSDIAREVADITLLDSDLSQLVTARLLGQNLLKRIQNNFNFIVTFNTALLILGIGNVLSPTTSALLHNLSTLGISAASMRPCLTEKK